MFCNVVGPLVYLLMPSHTTHFLQHDLLKQNNMTFFLMRMLVLFFFCTIFSIIVYALLSYQIKFILLICPSSCRFRYTKMHIYMCGLKQLMTGQAP